MDASIVVSLRIGSARNLRPAGNREVPRVGHGGIGHGPPGAGRCPWASCGLLVRCLGSAVPSAGYLAGSMSFPQGSFGREATPPKERGKWWTEGWTIYPSPVPHQRSKKGGRSHHFLPSRAARRYAGRGGTGEAQPRFAFPQRPRDIRVVPRLVQRFREVLHHNGDGFAL